MCRVLKRVVLLIAHVSGVKALWEEIGAEATLLLSARWLVASTAVWVWYTERVTGWPRDVAITVASDTLGAILGTVAVGTLSMELTVVLVKMVMEDRRKRDQKKVEKAQDEARKAQEEIQALRNWARENNIEIPPDLTTPAESAEPAESTN